MQPSSAWVLNLDAELEMEHCARPGAGAYTASQRTIESVRQAVPRIQGLIADGDTVLWPGDETVAARLMGKVWCVTDAALRVLTRANIQAAPMPSVLAARTANHRVFTQTLGGGAPGSCWIQSLDELKSLLDMGIPQPWLFKRAYGFAGRGQRRISGVPSEADRRWLDNALELGVVAEPLFDITAEFSLHGWLEADGQLRLGRPCLQRVDERGAWASGRLATESELGAVERTQLFESAERVASALSELGYFGPFGIDAYTYRDASGSVRFNPLSEINARYTMSWGLGMGS